MNSNEYLDLTFKKSEAVLSETLSKNTFHANCYYHASCLIEFSNFVYDVKEKEIIKVVATQIESSAFLCALGLYRQGFSTLRLALEMGLGVIYFSLNKLVHHEWLLGKGDIIWSQLIDIDNGVLSTRVKKVFLDDSFNIMELNNLARETYRELSEFVHGNQSTFSPDNLFIDYNDELANKFDILERKCSDILFLSYFIRYHTEIPNGDKDLIRDFYIDFDYIDYVRFYFGGPKDK